jgi:hypothetical protein
VQFVGRLVTRWQNNHRVWAIAAARHGAQDPQVRVTRPATPAPMAAALGTLASSKADIGGAPR